MSPRCLVPVLVLATACTTLGPTPATTGISAIPSNRPGAELQAGIVPAFYLSDAAHETDARTPGTSQISALLEPDRLFGTKGLILGARSWGEDGDSPFEPMVGLRRKLDQNFAIAGVAYGTHARGESSGASYSANRLGGELIVDATLLTIASWLAIHVQASVSATYLDAWGTYCVAGDGDAIDCEDTSHRVDATVDGIYTAATAGVSVDIARRPTGYIHGIRLALQTAIGGMPRLRDGVQEASKDQYRSIGLTLTLGLGDER